MARLLCLKAAWTMDTQGARAAAPLISQIKVVAPRVALEVIDQAVQMHGGGRRQPGFPARADVDAGAHAAPRRRAGRGAPARDRQGRNEALHQRGGRRDERGAFQRTRAALDAWASAACRGLRGPRAAKKFPTGQSNPTYLIEAASGRYVLRRKPPGKLLKSAHMIEREFRVLQGAGGRRAFRRRACSRCARTRA